MSIWTEVEQRYKPGVKLPDSLRVLITGLPRSGTFFTTDLLSQFLPKQVGHEAIFALQTVQDPPTYPWHLKDHKLVIEVSGLSAPWVRDCKDAGIKIVQLLRHPVRCISSNLNYFDITRNNLTWDETAEAYLKWHKQIEEVADLTIYLEHLPLGLALL
jgi:hypothetical protein